MQRATFCAGLTLVMSALVTVAAAPTAGASVRCSTAARVRAYYGCSRARRRSFRLRFPGGSAMVGLDESVLQPRLADRYFALVIGYADGPWMVAIWDLVARRNTYFGTLEEDVYPIDLELTSHGALAWVADSGGAVIKVDSLGRTKIGAADADAAACGDHAWCRSTLALDGDNLSWRERGVTRAYWLRGRAPR